MPIRRFDNRKRPSEYRLRRGRSRLTAKLQRFYETLEPCHLLDGDGLIRSVAEDIRNSINQSWTQRQRKREILRRKFEFLEPRLLLSADEIATIYGPVAPPEFMAALKANSNGSSQAMDENALVRTVETPRTVYLDLQAATNTVSPDDGAFQLLAYSENDVSSLASQDFAFIRNQIAYTPGIPQSDLIAFANEAITAQARGDAIAKRGGITSPADSRQWSSDLLKEFDVLSAQQEAGNLGGLNFVFGIAPKFDTGTAEFGTGIYFTWELLRDDGGDPNNDLRVSRVQEWSLGLGDPQLNLQGSILVEQFVEFDDQLMNVFGSSTFSKSIDALSNDELAKPITIGLNLSFGVEAEAKLAQVLKVLGFLEVSFSVSSGLAGTTLTIQTKTDVGKFLDAVNYDKSTQNRHNLRGAVLDVLVPFYDDASPLKSLATTIVPFSQILDVNYPDTIIGMIAQSPTITINNAIGVGLAQTLSGSTVGVSLDPIPTTVDVELQAGFSLSLGYQMEPTTFTNPWFVGLPDARAVRPLLDRVDVTGVTVVVQGESDFDLAYPTASVVRATNRRNIPTRQEMDYEEGQQYLDYDKFSNVIELVRPTIEATGNPAMRSYPLLYKNGNGLEVPLVDFTLEDIDSRRLQVIWISEGASPDGNDLWLSESCRVGGVDGESCYSLPIVSDVSDGLITFDFSGISGFDPDTLAARFYAVIGTSWLLDYRVSEFDTPPPQYAQRQSKSWNLSGFDPRRSNFPTGFAMDNRLSGEVIISFDWSKPASILSDADGGKGWAETGGEALFTLLSDLGLLDNEGGSARPIHFIGHGTGAVVVSEAVERMRSIDLPVEHVTYLDPIDRSSDLRNQGAPNGYGVTAWEGVGFVDTYFQSDVDILSREPEGRPILGAFNVDVTQQLRDKNTPTARFHEVVAVQYISSALESTSTPIGFALSRLANPDLSALQLDELRTTVAEPNFYDLPRSSHEHTERYLLDLAAAAKPGFAKMRFAPVDAGNLLAVPNGDFEFPGELNFNVLTDSLYVIPGWTFYGGGGSRVAGDNRLTSYFGSFVVNYRDDRFFAGREQPDAQLFGNYGLRLYRHSVPELGGVLNQSIIGPDEVSFTPTPFRTHDRIIIPQDAGSLSFDARVLQNVHPKRSADHLEVRLGNDILGSWEIGAELVEGDQFGRHTVRIPSHLRGQSQTLTFQIVAGSVLDELDPSYVVDVVVDIDNVQLEQRFAEIRTGDVAQIRLKDVVPQAKSFSIPQFGILSSNGVAKLTAIPQSRNRSDLDLYAEGKLLGQIVFPQNQSSNYEQSGEFYFAPGQGSNLSGDTLVDLGFQGQVVVDFKADGVDHRVLIEVLPGFSVGSDERAKFGYTTFGVTELQQRLNHFGFLDYSSKPLV
ncbi:MAG: LEPR-XLL domain-containing protein, partial [Planctomycetales bacterium]|nr:LEPR-XLL domain-containing protein [Planctomycetales bacterium]